MFARTRNQLTVTYTLIIAVFLFAVIAVIYFGLSWMIQEGRKEEVLALAEEVSKEQWDHLKYFYQLGSKMEGSTEHDNRDISGYIFYYVIASNGQMVSADLPVPILRKPVLKKIKNWNVQDGDTIRPVFQLENGQKVTLIMVARHFYSNQQLLGTIYVGKDITGDYMVLHRLVILLILVSIVFIFFTAVIGQWFARRAMIPIGLFFERQKQFVADASHELRTPLSVLLLSLDAVTKDTEGKVSPFAAQVLTDMRYEVIKLSEIVANLLNLARFDAVRQNMVREVFDLGAVVEEVVCRLAPLAAEKGIGLEHSYTAPITVCANGEQIRQLILILLDNGLKYTLRGGLVKVTLDILSRERGGQVKIRVEDTGIGIAPEYQARIFERFYRIDNARSGEIAGTGLGLSIAQDIANSEGGTISVDSTRGRGSVFEVRLPIVCRMQQ